MRFRGLLAVILAIGCIYAPSQTEASAQAAGEVSLVVGPPPVPETALGVPIDPDKGYVVEALGSGLYWLGNGGYIVMFLVGEDGVALVDAPPAMATILQAGIAEVTDLPVTHFIYSHGHGDHVGAAGLFADAVFIGQAETVTQLARGGPCVEECLPNLSDPRPVPQVTFEDRYTLDMGMVNGERRILELAYRGPNHQPGNILVHHRASRTLMMVDVVYPGWVPFDLLAVSADIPGWIDAYDDILAYDFAHFVGGHLGRTGDRADVELTKAFLDDLIASATAALRANPRGKVYPPLIAEHGPENGWWLTDQHTRAVTEACAVPLVTAWEGRLGGVVTFADDLCERMAFSLRLD
jgi:glyoxylase-like metal-dependent hydrolase (beta-lactamase superfamily II)